MTDESQANDKRQKQPGEKRPLREIHEGELKQVLENHRKWLESGRKQGEQADLKDTNLRDLDLEGVCLRGAVLFGADLRGALLLRANLAAANLGAANLREADLRRANLKGTDFSDAVLKGADLRTATGLEKYQIDGAIIDYTTQLPDYLTEVKKIILPDELKSVLDEHQEWIKSDGKKGKRADLSGADLEGVDFHEFFPDGIILVKAILQGARLNGARLDDADLSDVNLSRASLNNARMERSNFHRADLSDAYIQHADLAEAELVETRLSRANLERANLTDTMLKRADLDGADLKEAQLLRATAHEVNLQDADLTGARGLLAGQLGGANVCGSRLPEDIHKFEGLKVVEEASRNSRKIFLAMLLGSVYSWLTMATTTDVALLTNSSSSPLPIIGTGVPIVGFYLAAPVLLLGVYAYFHLYMQRLWEGLAELPAVFPDGRPLDKRTYPWLLNGLVRAHFKLLRQERPPLSRLQTFVSILLAWWVIPFTLSWFWMRYLTMHDWTLTVIHLLLLVLSIGFGILTYSFARQTLRNEELNRIIPTKFKTSVGKNRVLSFFKMTYAFCSVFFKDLRTYKRLSFFLGIAAILALISQGAIDGMPPDRGSGLRTWVPRAFLIIGYNPFADFYEAELSTKPQNWTGNYTQFDDVRGVRLLGKNLQYINAQRADMMSTDLRKADLRGADLRGADLRNSDLRKADLRGANLDGAQLHYVDFRMADLRGATGLTFGEFAFAVFDSTTIFPTKFKDSLGGERGLAPNKK